MPEIFSIGECQLAKAASDETAFNKLAAAIQQSKQEKQWLIVPCLCKPPCKLPAKEELKRLEARLKG